MGGCESGYGQKSRRCDTIIGVHKMKGISRYYGEILTFQEENCCMEISCKLYLPSLLTSWLLCNVSASAYFLYYNNYYHQCAFLTYGLIQKQSFRIRYSMCICVRCGVVSCPVVYRVTVTEFFLLALGLLIILWCWVKYSLFIFLLENVRIMICINY